jgi:phosphopantothenoylcysteine decarboxylase/phosphopantothenate--cysteine ligase
MPDSPSKFILCVSGGIAAYKSAELAGILVRTGAGVRVAMTRSAEQFVKPLTFEALTGHHVYRSLFDQPESGEMEHISWARWADTIVVAPASANLIARIAHGLADDAVTSLLLAFDGRIFICPAMNTTMLNNPATRSNLDLLEKRGMKMIESVSGPLACGEVGDGRMAQPQDIAAGILQSIQGDGPETESTYTEPDASNHLNLSGRHVLVTAGPTREMLDPIRFISNTSSGLMGTALARTAHDLGARVTLVHGPMGADIPETVQHTTVQSAREMLEGVQNTWNTVDIAVFAAAVMNYESTSMPGKKIKSGESLKLELSRTPDIAAWAGINRIENQVLVGFAAESENLLESAREKLMAKKLDLICANHIGTPGVGFNASRNQVTLLDSQDLEMTSPLTSKFALACWIWEQVLVWQNARAKLIPLRP